MTTMSMQKTATFAAKTSSHNVNSTFQNGFHGESDSLEEMLKEMRENHNKILNEHFGGNRDNMLSHFNNMLDTQVPDTTLMSLPNHPPMENDTGGLKELQDHYQVEIDVNGYSPEEITVRTQDYNVIVEGKHEEKAKEGQRQVCRQFSRRISLPPNIDREKITPSLTSNGLLTITAHKDVSTNMMVEDLEAVNSGKEMHVTVNRKETSQPHTSKVQITQEDSDPVRALIQRMNERQQSILQRHFRGDSEEMIRHCQRLVDQQMNDDPFVRMYTRSLSNTATQQDVSNANNEMIIKLDVRQFSSKEISVKTVDRCLLVEAKHEGSDGPESASLRHVIKRYELPEDVDTKDISSNLEDGTLIIHVPRNQQFKGKETIVPITVPEGQEEKAAKKRYKTEIHVNMREPSPK